ncbi:MAG: tetratricopeptide repeat protein [Chitinophagaceae bacterium]|nr:tetratricopeptide repeat protein [Chitinophagaceae bacterium]
MKQTIRFTVVAVLLCNIAFAQSVDEGKKLFYYEKYQSAKEILEKALAAKPGDVEAAYWLGQALIEQKEVAAAKAVYQTALQSKGSDPLLLVAMGHVELLENKTNEARQRFEVAISTTKNRNIDVLNAIGRANADAPAGDANYAIEKLKAATEIKKFKEPSVYTNMGDAYRKLADGGGAVTSYNQALGIEPNYAESKYKVGKIYLTQGNDQSEIFLRNFEEAIKLDPAYAPAYYELYKYWYSRDVNKARDYFAKYKANTDFNASVEAEEISLVYASGDFSGAIAKADEKLKSEGEKADAKLYRVKAYAYDKLGDSVNALQNMETFFAKANPDDILSDNYVKIADISAKFPDKIEKAESYYDKLFEIDTTLSNRLEYAKAASDMYKKIGNRAKSADWLTKILALKPNYGKTDLFYAGWENFYGDQYQTADSIAGLYKEKYPDDTQGYYLAFRTRWLIDSTMEQGLPVEDAKKFIEIAEVDKEKNKQALILAYKYLAGYSNNELKDAETALMYLNKVLELNPSDQEVKGHIEILEQALKRQPKQKTSGSGK